MGEVRKMTESSGCVIWLTGIPGSGKTTIAKHLESGFRDLGLRVEVLDGDEVRENLSPELGFSKEDRVIHAKRVVYISGLLARNGVICVVSLISPFRSIRSYARDMIGARFVEVWVKASTETCQKRDPKGLYKKAAEGKISSLTGVQDPYEPPLSPEIVLDTESESPMVSVARVMTFVMESGYLEHSPVCSPERGIISTNVE
jgi:adenylylsulfate kinase